MRFGDAVFRLFVALAVVQLVGEALVWRELMAVVKPLLIPLLAWAWWRSVPQASAPVRRLMMVFYAASWVGDVALLLAPEGPADVAILGVPKHGLWFLVGVAAFAVAHGALIGLMRSLAASDQPWAGRWWWWVPAPIWVAALGGVVVPAVLADPERAMAAGPVAAYGALLVAVVSAALGRAGRTVDASFRVTLAGAVVFLLSDSSIGVVHLVHRGQVPLGGLLIMSTYLAAEVLLGHGLALGITPERGQQGPS
jgi:hypothetical protein